MKNFFKKIFTIGAIAGVGYLGFKGYTRISEVMKLSKTLPDYLADLLEEKPNVDINMRLNSMSIAVGVTADTYENINFDLDSQINRYIVDYYPGLSKLNISTHKYIKSSSENETINKEESDVELNQEIENDELDVIDDNIEDIEK